MPITFNGVTITVGAPFYGDASIARAGGRKCTVKDQGGVGAAIDPFWFEIPCECEPQPGDTIEMSATTILLVDVTTIRWDLCGHKCRGEHTGPGFSIGLEIKRLKWVVE